MSALRLTAGLFLVFCLLISGVSEWWRPKQKLVDLRPKVVLEQMFPKSFEEWTVDESRSAPLVSPDVQSFIDKIYNQTISRVYINRTGERVMLSVAYGGDQSDATRTHRPEVCYPAQGFQIGSSSATVLSIGQHPLRVRTLVARLGARSEPITYWTIVGDRVAVSGTEQKLAQLAYTTTGVVPDGMLVRISTIDADAQRAFSVHRSFINSMSGAIPANLRAQVVGKPAS